MVNIKRPLPLPHLVIAQVNRPQQLIFWLLGSIIGIIVTLYIAIPNYFAHAFVFNFAYSIAITSLSSIVASLVALPIALTMMALSTRKLLLYLGFLCIPLTISPLAVATVLSTGHFQFSPYGETIIIATQFISVFPFSVLLELFVLDRLGSHLVIQSLQLSLGSPRWMWKAHKSTLAQAIILSFVLGTGILLADPSLHLVFGGTTPFLSNHIFHVLSSGEVQTLALPHTAALVLLSIIAALILSATLQSSTASSVAISDDERNIFWKFPLTRLVVRLGKVISGIYFGLTILILIRIVFDGFLPGRLLGSTAADITKLPFGFSHALWSTAISVIPVVLISWALSLYSASITLHRPKLAAICNSLMVFQLLISLTAGGILIAFLHQDWIAIGGLYLVPPLVGNAGYGNGYFAIALSYLSIAFPVAHLVSYSVFETYRPAVLTARDLGAGRIRIFFTIILPNVFSVWIPTFALLLGLLLARNTPSIFVDSATFPQIGPTIVSAAEEGNDSVVYALTAASSLLSITFFVIGLGGLLLFLNRRRSHEPI
ncbi:ABC transporter permease family protein [Arcanobacterium ihumii]|uniref:hypothetical protein n=1 Tax=Arcanobacterium ihumii TaxID=2138162 RepID=UPI000F53FBC4|nr:hypothetical protein [Arcanobacterium ihumii]